MSISESLYIGASGLLAHGNAMSVVGDNIANASTIGFKRERASFADMLGGAMGNQRMGGGVYLGQSQTMYDQGAIAQTGNPLDVAISGGGMFVVKGAHDGVDQTYLSRDGRFQLDNTGYLVDQQGLRVQGYGANPDGTTNNTVGDLQVGNQQSAPVPTTKASLTMNLDSDSPDGTATPFDPASPDATSQYQTSMQVTDSLGKSHKVDVFFHNDGGGNWSYHAMADGADLTGGTAGTLTEIGTGTLTFDPTGKMTASSGSITGEFLNAAQDQPIALDFTNATQVQLASSANVTVDGHGAGNLEGVSIDPDGKVEGTYDNGDKLVLGQVAMGTVPNEDGLTRAGDGLYATTNTSGQASIDKPGTAGRGSLVAGALEQSNVDLGSELVTLIAYQRAFQANSKTVTTADDMLQTVDNLIR